jgi:hypothetical protein
MRPIGRAYLDRQSLFLERQLKAKLHIIFFPWRGAAKQRKKGHSVAAKPCDWVVPCRVVFLNAPSCPAWPPQKRHSGERKEGKWHRNASSFEKAIHARVCAPACDSSP